MKKLALPLNHKHKVAGFTLIEMMVAVSIFVIVALIATGAFITANQVNQKAQAIKLVMDNLNFALDSMSLKIRKSGNFYCSRNISDPSSTVFSGYGGECGVGGGNLLGFISKSHDPNNANEPIYFAYRLNNSHIEYSGTPTSNLNFSAITTDDAVIESLNFRVFNETSPTLLRPRVLVTLRGYTLVGGQKSSFGLETTVSER